MGAQFTALDEGSELLSGSLVSIGGGARFAYNLTRYLALESEVNYFSRDFSGATRYQGQFGVKAGMRYERFGIFAKARPGFVKTYEKQFSMDLGGVLELYPAWRTVVRFDVGDTIVSSRTYSLNIRDFGVGNVLTGTQNSRVFGVRNVLTGTHNLQLSAGVAFRF
ncbi:MAG: hypothetical protein J2P31_05685 [Blastocatellia bacterium]|nr:hypothetical protein [Blastocatellia bacterium]